MTHERVYVVDEHHHRVLGLDRRRGRLVQTIPVGRRPVGITLGGGA